MTKESFVLYTSYTDQIDSLADTDAGMLFKTILHYVRDGVDLAILTGEAKMAFSFIRYNLDLDARKWEEKRQKRQEAGRNGGNARAENLRSSAAVSGDMKQKVANVAGNVYVNGNLSVNENVYAVMREICFPDSFANKANEWFRYKTERDEMQVAGTIRSTLAQMKDNIEKYGEDAVAALIDLSIQRGWKGLFYERLETNAKGQDVIDYGCPEDFYK